MKRTVTFFLLLGSITSFCQTTDECAGEAAPYWVNGINSRVKGENIKVREVFKVIKDNEESINPKNGFITLRINVSSTGQICDIETFQIDTDYKPIIFNDGELVEKLNQAALGLTEWERDINLKTYNLIRLKIKDGRITQIF